MRTLLLATGNAKKARELREICGDAYRVLTLTDVDLGDIDIDESATTFAGNAKIKVDAVDRRLQSATVDLIVGDDSGLVVDALNSKPGVRSARFAADHGTGVGDVANNALLMTLMAPVPMERRTARFVAHIHALVRATGARADATGVIEGHIAFAPHGGGGFGYDPLFLPTSAPGRTFAELSAQEKHARSHRGQALRAVMHALSATRT